MLEVSLMRLCSFWLDLAAVMTIPISHPKLPVLLQYPRNVRARQKKMVRICYGITSSLFRYSDL